jgi:hypothetical protein
MSERKGTKQKKSKQPKKRKANQISEESELDSKEEKQAESTSEPPSKRQKFVFCFLIFLSLSCFFMLFRLSDNETPVLDSKEEKKEFDVSLGTGSGFADCKSSVPFFSSSR